MRIRLGLGFVDVVLFLIVELWLEYDLRRCEWLGLFVCVKINILNILKINLNYIAFYH